MDSAAKTQVAIDLDWNCVQKKSGCERRKVGIRKVVQICGNIDQRGEQKFKATVHFLTALLSLSIFIKRLVERHRIRSR
jgi:hypothetical protein